MIKKFYLKLLMSLMLLALAVPQVWAEALTVANNSATSSNIPVCCNYFDGNTMSQTIYSTSLLNDVVGKKITSIKYHASSALASSLAGAVLQISTGETTESTIPGDGTYYDYGVLLTGLTANGTYTIKGGETEIEFVLSEPIIFSGDKNLAVEVKLQASISGYTSVNWLGENQDGKVSVYARGYSNPSNNKDAFMPKTTFTYELASTDPTITVDPETVTINTDPYTAGAASFTVTGTNLTNDINLSVSGSGFAVNPQTITAANAANGVPVTVTYSAQEAGTFNGTITLTSKDAESKTVDVTANVIQPVISGTVTPTSLNFETYAGVAATQTISIENTGNKAFIPAFTVAAPFSIAAATEIAVGETKTFDVTYTPTAVGTDNGTLTVTINGTPTIVSLNGTANEAPKELTVAEDGTATSYHIPITGNYFDNDNDFGQTIYNKNDLGLLANKNITKVKYYSNDAIQAKLAGIELEIYLMETPLDEIEFNGDSFRYIPFEFTGSPNGTYTISGNEGKELEFNLSTPFAYSGNNNLVVQLKVKTKGSYQNIPWVGKAVDKTIGYYAYSTSTTGHEDFLPKTTFSYSDSETPAPVISGTVTPTTLEFGTVTVGENGTATITVENTGNTAFTPVFSTLEAPFSIEEATEIAAGESKEFTVTYHPTAAGDDNGSFTVTIGEQELITVTMTGKATEPAVEYAVTISDNTGAHNYGNVLVNSTNVWTLTITNNGTESVTPTLSGIEAPFSTTYPADALAAGESVNIAITFAPTEVNEYSNTITISFPEAGDAIAAYTCELTGNAVEESPEPSGDDNEVVKLITVDKQSIYEPNFIDTANGNNTPQQLNCYNMYFRMAQPDDPAKQIKAGDLRPGNNLFEFYAIDDFGTEFRFATINLFAEGNADAPAMYILGEAEGNNWGSNIGVKMDTQDGETFTKQVTFNGKNNENGQMVDYFSFSSKLADNWDAIAQYRLTPVADGNFWITDTYLSNPYNISLVQGTEKSIRIPAGTYNITVNATNKTCLVEKVNDATVTSAPRNASKPSKTALEVPIKVTPSVEYYTEEGMPVHPTYSHNSTLKYQEKFYYNVNDLLDLEGVIDYVNDTWSANTATNSHPDHYKFQIRGVGQFGDLVTSLTSEYVESHMTGYGNSLVLPEGWERGSWVGPNNEIDNVHTYYYYDLYIKRSFFDERGITGPVTVVVNTTLSGSGFNADNYKAMSVNGVEQIIAKEEFKDYSWTVPLGNDLPENTVVEQVPMGVVIRLVSTGADFNRTTGIYIYGGGTGVSNIDTVGIYKSSMNVKAYTQKQVDEDTDRGLVAMKNGDTETSRADVNVLAYADPAVISYKLYENSSASTTDMSHVATAIHNENGSYTVNSVSDYNYTYEYVRDETLGNIDGMWLPMYPAESQKYFLPVTYANGVGDDGVVRSENNTYGSAMQQVEKNGSVSFTSSKCERSQYTWVKDGVTYSYFSPDVVLNGVLPADGYELYNYRFWVDYEDDAPAWDFEIVDGKTHLTTLMDRPLAEGTTPHLGGQIPQSGKENWVFVAPADINEVKLVARYYYKKTTAGKARPTDRDRLYYVVENQVTVPVGVITGIDNVASKNVAGVKYYNLAGVESDVPFQGVNIEVTTYEDGSRTTRKIMK